MGAVEKAVVEIRRKPNGAQNGLCLWFWLWFWLWLWFCLWFRLWLWLWLWFWLRFRLRQGSLYLYCCAKGEHMRNLKEPNIFWTNKDGTRRMRNTLNDDGDKISLLRPDETFVASCEKVPGEEAVIMKSKQ